MRRISSPETVIYAGEIMAWGKITKTIPCPPGMPQISNARIRISDHYRKWRDLFTLGPPRRRVMRITVLPEGASLADYDPIYVGEVVKVVYYHAFIEIELQDKTYAWLDEEFPAMAIAALHPDISPADDGGFIPHVFGNVFSLEVSPQFPEGQIPLPHIGLVTEGSPAPTFDRWAVASTPVATYTLLRRQTVTVDQDVDVPEWQVVPEEEYVTTLRDITADENPFGSFTMTFTYADFIEQQPEGTEIRADISGIYIRGDWGPLTALPTSPPVATLNLIDHIINASFFLMQKAGVSTEVFDTEEIAGLWAFFENSGLYHSMAITEPITGRELLGQWLSSGNLDMYTNRRGKITFNYTLDPSEESPQPTPPTIKSGKHIYRDSFVESQPERVVTQLHFRTVFNNATGKFAVSEIVNTADQEFLNLDDEEKIEKDDLDLYAIRDSNTASEIVARRLAFQSTGSLRQTFTGPLRALIDVLELGQLIKITAEMGAGEIGGYVGRQAKILGLTYDLDELEVEVDTILYPPQTFVITEDTEGDGRFTVAEEWEDPAFVNPARSYINDGNLAINKDAAVGESATYAEMFFISSTSTAKHAQLILSIPDTTVPESFTSLTVHVVVSNVKGVSTLGPGPAIQGLIFNARETKHPGELGFHDHYIDELFSLDYHDDSPPTEYTVTFSAAEFNSAAFFSGSVNNIFVRFHQWNTATITTSTPYKLRPYDAWVTFE